MRLHALRVSVLCGRFRSSIARSQRRNLSREVSIRLLAPPLPPRRSFFAWLTIIFNRVDEDRIKLVGPDRACAEWLLRNGAAVKWVGASVYLKDYNSLPPEKTRLQIRAVDATDSAISHVGFPHFYQCKYIDDLKLVRCMYLENEALSQLSLLRESLTSLEVVGCANITDEGLLDLKKLRNLKSLKLGGMPYMKDKLGVVGELKKALPSCQIEFE